METFSGDNLVAIEELAESGHAAHLLLYLFLQTPVVRHPRQVAWCHFPVTILLLSLSLQISVPFFSISRVRVRFRRPALGF